MADTSLMSFSGLAVKYGMATPDQITKCRKIQRVRKKKGKKSLRLHQVMVAKGFMTTDQVKKVAQLMKMFEIN